MIPKNKISFFGFVFVVVFILGYGLFRILPLWRGVSINLSGIEDGGTFALSLPISGTADRAQELYINDRFVLLDQNGGFSDTLVLLPGYNIITVRGIDRFGKAETLVYRLVGKEPPKDTVMNAEENFEQLEEPLEEVIN